MITFSTYKIGNSVFNLKFPFLRMHFVFLTLSSYFVSGFWIELVYCQPNHLDLSDGFLDHVFFGSLLAAARVLVHLDGAEKGEAKDGRGCRVHA